MTLKEFSNEFDLLYNNISSNAAPGLNEYEKSVFLTQAQEDFIIGVYTGKLSNGTPYEGTEEIKRYLDSLIIKTSIQGNFNTTLNSAGTSFTLPNDLLYLVYEQAKANNIIYKIQNITHDEYDYMLENPFKGPLSGRVLCLTNTNKDKELIPPAGVQVEEYIIKYIKIPTPIILADLNIIGGSIKGKNTITECSLHEATHSMILTLAVNKAAQAYKA